MSELGLVSEFRIYVPETAKNGKEIRSGLSGGGGRANLAPPRYPIGKRRPFATSSAAKSPSGGRKKCTLS